MKVVLTHLGVSLYILMQPSAVESKAAACKRTEVQCGRGCQAMCTSPFQLTAHKKNTPKKKPSKKKPSKKKPKKKPKKKKKPNKKKPTKKPSKKKPTKKPSKKKPAKKPTPKKKPAKKPTPKKKSPKKKKKKSKRSLLEVLMRSAEVNSRVKRGKTKPKNPSKPAPNKPQKPRKPKKPKKPGPPKIKNPPLGDHVYRVLRPDERPDRGIRAKDPSAQKSIQSHVGCGCSDTYRSQYISATKIYIIAIHYGRQKRIAKIHLQKARDAGCRVDDIADGEGLRGPPYNFARASKEVLLSGCTIPAAAITVLKTSFS